MKSHSFSLWAIGAFAAVAFALVAGFLAIPHPASANPSTFCYDQTSNSTTTPTAMTPGTATTTLTTTNCAGATALDSAEVEIQYTTTATAPVLKMRIEDSFDGIDWYPDNGISFLPALPSAGQASTTIATTPFREYSFTVSTTTDNGGSGTSSRVHLSFPIAIRAPYTRLKFYIPTGGGNGSVWAQFVGKRQNK